MPIHSFHLPLTLIRVFHGTAEAKQWQKLISVSFCNTNKVSRNYIESDMNWLCSQPQIQLSRSQPNARIWNKKGSIHKTRIKTLKLLKIQTRSNSTKSQGKFRLFQVDKWAIHHVFSSSQRWPVAAWCHPVQTRENVPGQRRIVPGVPGWVPGENSSQIVPGRVRKSTQSQPCGSHRRVRNMRAVRPRGSLYQRSTASTCVSYGPVPETWGGLWLVSSPFPPFFVSMVHPRVFRLHASWCTATVDEVKISGTVDIHGTR
jgi:hypothetical protein